ncbi:MAG: substrate-binding domain-containing protein, partial [Butyrivibrio sp.]|nr:substrate-binding domain-containing protein [Butyrivibrio sp.]
KVAAALDRLLKKNPDCIVCTDDSVCTTVLNRLAALGISIPKDMGVASFYNSTTLDNHRPSVTSLEFDAAETGTLAFDVLIDRIGGKDVKERTLLGYNIMERESTLKNVKKA